MTDREALHELLGRPPQGSYEVAVRDLSGAPLVIRNEPFLDDGTPMPTRYWLVDPAVRKAIGTIESTGGVRLAEAEIDREALDASHARYAAEREAAIPAGHGGPRPTGGVGGTRIGLKCLHAHYAWYLADADGPLDPAGAWTHQRLIEMNAAPSVKERT